MRWEEFEATTRNKETKLPAVNPLRDKGQPLHARNPTSAPPPLSPTRPALYFQLTQGKPQSLVKKSEHVNSLNLETI